MEHARSNPALCSVHHQLANQAARAGHAAGKEPSSAAVRGELIRSARCRAPYLAPQSNAPRGAAGLPEVRRAYEYTLDRLGQDPDAGLLWLDYIALLQARKGG